MTTARYYTLYEAVRVETDYPLDTAGAKVWIGTCSCGWRVVRQREDATRRQLARHVCEAPDA